jgi:hypothetical protein
MQPGQQCQTQGSWHSTVTRLKLTRAASVLLQKNFVISTNIHVGAGLKVIFYLKLSKILLLLSEYL